MRKGLKISLWGLGTVVILLMALVFVGPTIFGWMLASDHPFGDKPLPDAPDYTLRAHWSAWPDDASPAERRPDGVPSTPQEARLASAFNGCCRVYAPRFRQSNIMGYQEEDINKIMDIGYQDVRAAFRHLSLKSIWTAPSFWEATARVRFRWSV